MLAKFHLRNELGGSFHTADFSHVQRMLDLGGWSLVRIGAVQVPDCFSPAEGTHVVPVEVVER